MDAQKAMLDVRGSSLSPTDEGALRASSSKSSNSSPSSAFPFEVDSLSAKINRLEFQRQLILETQELSLRFNSSFYNLRKAFAEVSFLREENLKLRTENLDLSTLVAEKENELISSISNDLVSRLTVQPKNEREVLVDQSSCDGGATSAGKYNVPKVISVRSNGFLATNKSKSKNVCKFGTNRPLRLRLASQGDGESEEMELEVYNQGMLKTELCNKWDEAGNCPYADRCQFAHGIEELRPVIRHPRYKTEICRMISSGGTCPYGHRCHFRHSLDPQAEKELVI